jgi:hypothetical protein
MVGIAVPMTLMNGLDIDAVELDAVELDIDGSR